MIYTELTQLATASEVSLLAAPVQREASLPLPPIPAGSNVQLVGSDPDGAWLLVLYRNTLGWLPVVYLGFGAGRQDAAVLTAAPIADCAGYLGSALALDQAWTAPAAGPIAVRGAVYLPKGSGAGPDWGLLVLVQESDQQYAVQTARAPLAGGGEVYLFAATLANVQPGWHVRISPSGPGSSTIPFQAGFYSADCTAHVGDTHDHNGDGRVGGPTPVATMFVITVQVWSGGEPRTTWTPGPASDATTAVSAEPWEACPGVYLSRLHVGDHAFVSYDPPYKNRVRQSPAKGTRVLGQIAPGEQIELVDGPSCSDGYVWWKIVATKDGLTGWTSEGDSQGYWLVPQR